MTILTGKIHISYLLDESLRTLAILDECLHRNDAQAMLFRKLQKLRRTHHMPIIIHDLTAKSRREKPR